jgi:glycosyltransferase involved in cell wall biosynthesis
MPRPDISLVIPAFNEEKNLPRLFETIKNQDFKGTFEIIVVDNNSTDKTAQVAKKLGARVVKEKVQGIGPAKNRGCLEAKGEILAICDADNLLPPNWLSTIWENFSKSKGIVAVSGSVFIFGIPKIFSCLFWFFYLIFLKIFKRLEGCNMAFRKDAFLKVGGFTKGVKFGENIDISEKLKKVGKIFVNHKLFVYFSPRRYQKQGWIKGLFPYLKLEINFLLTRNTENLKKVKIPPVS